MRDRQRPQTEPVQVATTAPESAASERDERIRRYLVTMGIRTVSFALAIVTDGWVRWTFVALAVFLPYVAVVAANAVRPRGLGQMRRADGPTMLELPSARPAGREGLAGSRGDDPLS